MANVILVEENEFLGNMYKSILENTGFKVFQFPNYKELYKNLNGEGFTAVLIDVQSMGRSLDFISKIRKTTKRQIPIFVIGNYDTDPDPFLLFNKVSFINRFPESGKVLAKLSEKLYKSHRKQFKNLLPKTI